MRVDTIELLRCPANHELTPLVTVANARDGDRLLEGVLGCPVCYAEYALSGGVVVLSDTSRAHTESERRADALRTAALLGLDEAGARVLLVGTYAECADDIERAVEGQCIAANAALATGFASADALIADGARAIPFANAVLHGIAIDHAHQHWLADAVRVVRVGGRILAPAHAPVPDNCKELARDDHEWVGVVTASSSVLIELKRGDAIG